MLAYDEKKDILEVISFDLEEMKNRFHVVNNFSSGKKKEKNIQKKIETPSSSCMNCHQGGKPIYPVSPWYETNNNPRVAQKIITARGLKGNEASNLLAVFIAGAKNESMLHTSLLSLCKKNCTTVYCRQILLLTYLNELSKEDPQAIIENFSVTRSPLAKTWVQDTLPCFLKGFVQKNEI